LAHSQEAEGQRERRHELSFLKGFVSRAAIGVLVGFVAMQTVIFVLIPEKRHEPPRRIIHRHGAKPLFDSF
jgi:hypothetical protein